MFADGGLHHTSTVDEQGDVWIMGELPGYPGLFKIPTKVPNLQNITQICCGNYHVLALSQTNEVYALGDNRHGQLGITDQLNANFPTKIENLPPIQSISCGGFHSLIIDHENIPWGFGENGELQLGIEGIDAIHTPKRLTSFKNIKITCCGRWFSCFVDFEENFYFCGTLKPNKTLLTKIKFPNGKEIVAVKAGYYYTLILFNDGSVYICEGKSDAELIDFHRLVKSFACGANFFLLLDYDGFTQYFEVIKGKKISCNSKENND